MTVGKASPPAPDRSLRRLLLIYRDLSDSGGVPYETRSLFQALASLGWEIDYLQTGGKSTELPPWVHRSLRVNRSLVANLRTGVYQHVVVVGALIPQQTVAEVLLAVLRMPRLSFPHGILTNSSTTLHFGGANRGVVSRTVKALFVRCVALPMVRAGVLERYRGTRQQIWRREVIAWF